MPQMRRSSAEQQGIPSTAILSFVDAAQVHIDAIHSFMLARHGHVVAEGWWHPYQADRTHMLFSVSKSFTSTAVGLAVAEGLLSVDDPVLPLFPDAAPAVVGPHLAAMRVRDLLTMTTGHAADTVDRLHEASDGDWASAFLAQPVEYEPGTHFVYNSGATYLLSAIVQRLTAVTLVEFLRPRLFEPLGITDPFWETCPRGVNTGGWGLNLRTEDILHFGQLYLDGGVWNGHQVLPKEWIQEATSYQVRNDGRDGQPDWEQGYGYQFWRSRHDAYRADGAFGQFVLVLPDLDAVLAVTSGSADLQGVLDLVWTHLRPAMADLPLPEDTPARRRLDDRLSTLALPPVRGLPSPLAAEVSGRTYQVVDQPVRRVPVNRGGLPTLDTVTFTQAAGTWVVRMVDELGTHDFHCGDGHWRDASATDGVTPIAVTGGWVGDDTFDLRLCFTATPFIRTYSCRFDGTDLTVTARDNVSFRSTEHPPALARAVE